MERIKFSLLSTHSQVVGILVIAQSIKFDGENDSENNNLEIKEKKKLTKLSNRSDVYF